MGVAESGLFGLYFVLQ